jgi:hypothetical protein
VWLSGDLIGSLLPDRNILRCGEHRQRRWTGPKEGLAPSSHRREFRCRRYGLPKAGAGSSTPGHINAEISLPRWCGKGYVAGADARTPRGVLIAGHRQTDRIDGRFLRPPGPLFAARPKGRVNPHFFAGIDAWWVEPVRHGHFAMGRRFLDLPNVIVINVARGEIIDEAALYAHLIGSPHNSAGGAAWRDEYLRRAVQNCRRAILGETVWNLIGSDERML